MQAFINIQLVNSGHMLIVPKTHAAQLNDEVGAQLFRVAIRLDRALQKTGLIREGVILVLADGETAGQDVKCKLTQYPVAWSLGRGLN